MITNNGNDSSMAAVLTKMTMILATMIAILYTLAIFQTKKKGAESGRYLPCPKMEPSKRAYESFVFSYSPIWMFAMGVIVVTKAYETFTAYSYLVVCGGLALPFLLQPILLPSAGYQSPDAQRPLAERYSMKANLWLAVYSFIGNYWYTHYFYSVLKAKYTMPAHRLNNVPIALYFATHFYFSSYHVFSNALLRKVVTTYEAGSLRSILYVGVVICFSYFTAFMETLTISSYPYYSFEDFNMACTIGSAFYGIYFLVSFPGFFVFDNNIDSTTTEGRQQKVTLFETFVSSCGHGMIILLLLDFVRLFLNVPLIVGSIEK